jgi:hypothetical protein
MITVKVDTSSDSELLVKYTWGLFCKHFDIAYSYANESYDLTIGFGPDSDIQLSEDFYNKLHNKDYKWKSHFTESPVVTLENGQPDYFSSAFYLVNCVQELKSTDIDSIGRFEYQHSLQNHFNCVKEDLVSGYFSKVKDSAPALKEIAYSEEKSKFFISHDNDTFHASFLQDGFWALRNGRFDVILKLITAEALRNPGWINLDKIMDINDEHGIKSTFFWLVNKGDTFLKKGLKNADYNFDDSYVQAQVKQVESRGYYNGLHKSISKENYKEEAQRLSFNPIANRNHYLRLNVEEHYNELDNANIDLDFSLGFAEHYGFRNSYGVPFHPFDLATKKTNKVLEVPLAIMDTTFHTYLKTPRKDIANLMIDFLDENKNGKLLSVLWHNKFFTSYKFEGYLTIYKTMLAYFKQEGINPVDQNEIAETFKNH